MAVTATETVRTIVTDALLKIGAATLGQAPDASEADLGRRTLARMLKAWQTEGHPLYLRATYSLPLTTAGSYSLVPERPLRILSARLKRSGTEIPMHELTGSEYDEYPLKTSTGLPTTFHYDRQREDALFRIWPVLNAADGETVEITYEREIDDHASLNDVVDAPVEWHEAIVYGLALRLGTDFGTDMQRMGTVAVMAESAKKSAIASDAVGSVYFEPEDWRYG